MAVRYFLEQDLQAEERVIGTDPAFIHPVVFHQRVYQAEHVIGRVQDVVQIAGPAADVAFRGQQLRAAFDGRQRDAQVVGHRGHQFLA